MNGKAAIWWRISTDDQREISPDTQIQEALALAQQEGYQVPREHVIGTDWGSLEVWESPPMQRLRELIRNRAISAVFMYDADRGPSKPAHRLLFRALCEEYGVAVRCCHGQIPDGDMGEVMEFLSAWSKEKQVHRAQQGAKDGLRDRAKLRGLPTNGTAPYGYRFRYDERGGKKIPVALEPNPATYHIASRIWRMGQDGVSLRGIAVTLTRDEIPAPKGGVVWNPSTIARMLGNPAYGGTYYALRQEMKSPDLRRKSDSYGKSSSRLLPRESWQPLVDFPVEFPIVSWAEWEAVQGRLARNKAESRRNAKQFYMLRGMVFCSEDGRRMSGHSRRSRYVYECPRRRGRDLGFPRCNCPPVSGLRIESLVWEEVSGFLANRYTFQAEMERRRESSHVQEPEIRQKMAVLERKLRDVDNREAQLLNEKMSGIWTDEAVQRAAASLRAERSYLADETERLQAVLAALEQSHAAVASLEAMRERIVDRLDSAAPEERRGVLEALDTRVTVKPGGVLEISIGIPQHHHDTMRDCVHQPQGQ